MSAGCNNNSCNFFIELARLKPFSQNYLVYVFIGENWALLDFIDIMNDRNLFAKGEYVVLAIDNSIDDVSDNQVQIR